MNPKYRGIVLPYDFAGDVVLSNGNETLTISSNTVFYWTEIVSQGISAPSVKEIVYDANTVRLMLCSDFEDSVKRIKTPIKLFRSKWSDQWQDTPPVGEIFAKAVHPYGEFVTPIEFINIGTAPSIAVTVEDEETCIVKVDWACGNVFTTCGHKLGDGVSWRISKSDCENISRIPFTFTPANSDHRNAFTLHIKAPFKFFSIEDFKGNEVHDGVWIPYSEIDKYTYHIGELDIRSLRIGPKEFKLTWVGDSLFMYNVKEDGTPRRQISADGTLSTLLESREAVTIMLDKTAENMIYASVPVTVDCGKGRKLNFVIKESPYRIRQKGRTLTLNCGTADAPDFTGALMLYKLTEPSKDPYKLTYNPEKGYELPEDVSSWGKIIATGRRRGIICPALVDYNRDENDGNDGSKKTRNDIIKSITDEIGNAELDDDTWKRVIGWFNITQSQDLPASSFLDLVSVARSPETLIRLAFQLYCASFTDEDRDLLLNKLNYFSKDLAFQWFWILPTLQESLFEVLSFKMEDFYKDFFKKQYYLLSLLQDNKDDLIKAANANNDAYFNYAVNIANVVMSSFKSWMLDLCRVSLKETYKESDNRLLPDLIESILNKKKREVFDIFTDESYIDYNQYDLEDIVKFFKRFDDENAKAPNERWFNRRVHAITDHLNGNVDLFRLTADITDTDVADKIRRSMIFCFKTNRDKFLYKLNNLLNK